MADSASSLPTRPDPGAPPGGVDLAAPPRPAFRRLLLVPFRFARRRPRRALAILVLVMVVAAAAVAGGLELWFRHHLAEAREAVARGHNAEAARHLQACQRLRTKHPEMRLLLARVARRSGHFDEAERILDEYWAEHGDDEAVVFERLLLRAARGELEAAGPPLAARIAAGGPAADPAREALVTGYTYRFRWAEAARALDDWLALEPDSTAALLLRGKLDEQQSRLTEALASYRRVVALDPDHDEARLRLTTTLLRQFYGEEALGHLARLQQRLPNNADVAYQWAVALGLQGRTDEARAALDALLRTHPDHAGALAERGRYAALDGDDAAAADYLGRATRLDLGNLAVRHQYVQVLTRLGRAAEAAREQAAIDRLKADLEQINSLIAGPLQTTPNDPAVHHRIALIALHAGQPTEGLRWLQSTLQVDPDYLPAHQTLAGYYQATGNPVLAARHRAIASRLAGKAR